MADPAPTPSPRLPDWEAFYRDYRRPGYVPGFEITTKLGGGVFGLVFRARKVSIGKDYAIKFLKVEDAEIARAVLGELEQVKYFAQIDHPNLVSIEDRGEVDGIPYLVMQFAGTETLRDKLRTDGVPPTGAEKEDLLRWFLQACRGIAALHERSLVHFDVKPANVFLKGPVARVGDYGLSKLVTHSRGSLTAGRGTPYYMAPELLQRRGDARSDVYSLGVVLYEVLCGQVPFRGDSEWEVLKKHEHEPVPLPGHLLAVERAVLQRCLQKDPAARYQSVHDLIAALGAPSSVAAAAVREAAADGARSRGPGPTAPPPAGEPGGQTAQAAAKALAGFARASREALGHAQTAARGAMDVARTAAREVAATLREQKEQGNWFRRGRPEPRPPRRHARQAVMVLLASCLFLGLVFSVWGTPRSVGGPAQVYSLSGPTVPTPPVPPMAETPLLRVDVLPRPAADLVTVGPPVWASLVARDLEAASVKLGDHLQRLQQRLGALDLAAADLPSFALLFDANDPAVVSVGEAIGAVAAGRAQDATVRERLRQQERLALTLAAVELQHVDYAGADAVQRSQRLHEWLVEATGCHSIHLVVDPRLGAAGLQRANRNVGAAWMWYVNEMAGSESSWKAFLRTRKR